VHPFNVAYGSFSTEFGRRASDLQRKPTPSSWEQAHRLLPSRARPLRAILRIDELAAEAFVKLLGVFALGRAKDIRIDIAVQV
jgi:hypothetical protein